MPKLNYSFKFPKDLYPVNISYIKLENIQQIDCTSVYLLDIFELSHTLYVWLSPTYAHYMKLTIFE